MFKYKYSVSVWWIVVLNIYEAKSLDMSLMNAVFAGFRQAKKSCACIFALKSEV